MYLFGLTEDLGTWERIVDKYGIPGVLLGLLLILGFRYVVKPLVESHNSLITMLRRTNKANAHSLKKLTETVAELIKGQKAQETVFNQQVERQNDQLSKQDEILQRMERAVRDTKHEQLA